MRTSRNIAVWTCSVYPCGCVRIAYERARATYAAAATITYILVHDADGSSEHRFV